MAKERRLRVRSEATVRGWPLVAVAFGADPETGEREGHAKGIIAIGDSAEGVLALGRKARHRRAGRQRARSPRDGRSCARDLRDGRCRSRCGRPRRAGRRNRRARRRGGRARCFRRRVGRVSGDGTSGVGQAGVFAVRTRGGCPARVQASPARSIDRTVTVTSPLGRRTIACSPTRLPRRAWATGDAMLIRRAVGSASSGPTSS